MGKISWEPVLDLSYFFAKDKGLPYPFYASHTYFFGYGRVALMEGLKALGIKSGDNVIIPSYICNVVLAPFKHLEIETRYFEIGTDFKPRMEQMEDLIDRRTRAIMAINYFGFPSCNKEIDAICRKNNLFFIEN